MKSTRDANKRAVCVTKFMLNIELIYVGKQPTLDQNDATELIVPLPAPRSLCVMQTRELIG